MTIHCIAIIFLLLITTEIISIKKYVTINEITRIIAHLIMSIHTVVFLFLDVNRLCEFSNNLDCFLHKFFIFFAIPVLTRIFGFLAIERAQVLCYL